jgi:orotate phosphoribosyltransferase
MVGAKQDLVRERAFRDLQASEVLMVDGHYDYGNGYHGRAYLNPHQLFRFPSTIWRVAQDLLDVLPQTILEAIDTVAGPVTGGALLAHTLAGLLDGRRDLTRPVCQFAALNVDAQAGLSLRSSYAQAVAGKRVLLSDDVRNTGKTLERCAALVSAAGGSVIGTVQIYDRMEAVVTLPVPNIALVSYKAPANVRADECPMCRAGLPVTRF